ncbi:unnamed protein product, partial [Prorocentrum cordatum]
MFLHPLYAFPYYDIALLELEDSLPLGGCIDVACLPTAPVPAGTQCFITGWGQTETGAQGAHVQEGAMTILSDATCGQYYGRPGGGKSSVRKRGAHGAASRGESWTSARVERSRGRASLPR